MRSRTRYFGWLLLAGVLACGLRPADAVATTTDDSLIVIANRGSAEEKAPTTVTYAAAALDRYLPIVSRMPFGLPPPPPAVASAAAPVPSASATDLGRNCAMSVLARSPAEVILVGFTDNATKPPRNLLLAVGEEADGYKVLAADFDQETATLEKDGARFELRLNVGLRAPPAVYVGDLDGPRIGSIRLAAAGWTQPNAAGAAGTSAARLPAAESPDDMESSRRGGRVKEEYAARKRERLERLVKLNEETKLRIEQETAAQQQASGEDQPPQ